MIGPAPARVARVALLAAGLACAAAGPPPAASPAPQRVLSMNLCTDQLALLLAGPGQLVSVSALAQDPFFSAMAEAARQLPANHGRAEEIYLLRPDLVLAGRYTAQETVAILTRLGVRVELFDPEAALDDIPATMRRMGALLGRPAEGAALADGFTARLAALEAQGRGAGLGPQGAAASDPAEGPGSAADHATSARPRAALYAADGFTSGTGSLSGQILQAAGYDNVAEALGIGAGGYLTLEELVRADPDLIVEGRRLPGASRAEELLDHPALAALKERAATAVRSDPDWICGTPRVLDAIAALAALREAPR